jgi:hypothetical protein
MSGPVEHAAGVRADGNLPPSWGTPPGTAYSEERAAWVRRNARLQMAADIDKVEARKIADAVRREVAAERRAATVRRLQQDT